MKIRLSVGVVLAIALVSPLVKGDNASTPPAQIPQQILNPKVSVVRPSTPVASLFAGSGAIGAPQVQSLLKKNLNAQQDARSVVLVNNQLTKLDPNVKGKFGRIVLAGNQTVPVAVFFPQLTSGDNVAIEVEDGGFVGKNDQIEVMPVDSNQEVAFAFTSGTQDGVYRVTLRHGADVEELNFWVGKDLVFAPRNLPVKK
jgi:hypothetical protein